MSEELERIISEKKKNIDKTSEVKKKKLDFFAQEFIGNEELFTKYMKERNIDLKEAYHVLQEIIEGMGIGEPSLGGANLKELSNNIYIKSGYYQIRSDRKNLSPETFLQKCPLELTEKGEKVHDKYRNISA